MIEICLEAVKEATDLVGTGKALYFSDAVDQVSKDCMKRPPRDQVPCITGATEVLLRSKNQTASLEGKHQADCSFRCPAKGQLDFAVWPRKNESNRDACFRKLKTFVDAPQVPLCETIRIRSINGIGKAGTRMPFFRKKDLYPNLGKPPRVRIVRED